MKVSIIIPVYNVAPYIEMCLDSVISQTYKGEIECILVDDCGTDDSVAICEKVISKYNGPISFRIIHHEHNRGLSAARNTGIEASSGDWLYFLDSDDWIIPECIELMVDCLKKYPDSEMVFAGAKSSDGSFEYMMNYENKDLPPYSNNPVWIKRAMLFNVLNVTAWNKLVSKQLITQNKCYFAEGYIHEDEIWNFLLPRYLNKISICKHNTYQYLIRGNSIMTCESDAIRFKNRAIQLKEQINIVPSINKSFYLQKLWQELITLYRKASNEESKQVIKTILWKLLGKTNLQMAPVIFFSALMPYCFFNIRAVNWFFSKYDRRPNDVPPVI